MELSAIFPADLVDRGSAKIRLPSNYFASTSNSQSKNSPNHFNIGDLVIVYFWSQPDVFYLCTAWPNFAGDFASFDNFVSAMVDSDALILSEKAINPSSKAILYRIDYFYMFKSISDSTKPSTKVQNAAEIRVHFVGDATKNSHTNTKCLQVKALLESKYVCTGSLASFLSSERIGIEIAQVLIKSSQGPITTPMPVKITSSTQIKLLPLSERIIHSFSDPVTRVDSNEDYYQHLFFESDKANPSPNQSSMSSLNLENVGGMKKAKQSLMELLEIPLKFSDKIAKLGSSVPRGILLYGPPGVGKSLLIKEVSSRIGAPVIAVTASDIFSPILGQSELILREIFNKAQEMVDGKEYDSSKIGKNNSYVMGGSSTSGVIIFIDEIDVICSKRDSNASSNQLEARVVAQLLTLLEQTKAIVVAATNRPNELDAALRRPGRFDREIEIALPDVHERYDIIVKCSKNVKFDQKLKENKYEGWKRVAKKLAEKTIGFSGADITSMIREASLRAIKRIFHSTSDFNDINVEKMDENAGIEEEDFFWAFSQIKPTSQRGWTLEVPKTNWNDIGGLFEVKEKLKMIVEWPILHKQKFQKLGLSVPKGILLHGPPGCSKTTLVRAVANSCKASFVSLSGADVFSPLVGESERIIRDIFKKARASRPSIIFFDEIDAMVGKRGLSDNDTVSTRVLTQLLTEMDGIESKSSDSLDDTVLVMAATNRVDQLDSALLRPGRFDRIIEIPVPDEETRFEILKVHAKRLPLRVRLDDDTLSDDPQLIDSELKKIASQMECYSGADIESLCREAGICALKLNIESEFVTTQHISQSLGQIRPSLLNWKPLKIDEESEDQETGTSDALQQ